MLSSSGQQRKRQQLLSSRYGNISGKGEGRSREITGPGKIRALTENL